MGWAQQIEYVDVAPAKPAPVKKQVWDGERFVLIAVYKHKGVPDKEELEWLRATYGPEGVYRNGQFWDYTRAGNFMIMDEKVYAWFQMKWGNK